MASEVDTVADVPTAEPGGRADTETAELGRVRLRLKHIKQSLEDLSRLSLELRTLDMRRVVERVCQRALTIFGAKNCALYAPDDDSLRRRWYVRSVNCAAPNPPCPHLNAVIQEAVRTGQPVVAEQRGDCDGAADPADRSHGCMALPLHLYHEDLPPVEDETALPLLCLCGIEDAATLADEDLAHKLVLFSDIVAVSVANALAHAKAERMAYHDSLTDVKTRHVLDELLRSEWTRHKRYASPFAIALVDVDQLKRVNDTYGHVAGDDVLREVARTLDQQVRQSDTVVRYGGDEFAVLLPETQLDGATVVMARVLAALRLTPQRGDGPHPAISIGIAGARGKRSAEDVILTADRALYEAKRAGGNRVCSDGGTGDEGG